MFFLLFVQSISLSFSFPSPSSSCPSIENHKHTSTQVSWSEFTSLLPFHLLVLPSFEEKDRPPNQSPVSLQFKLIRNSFSSSSSSSLTFVCLTNRIQRIEVRLIKSNQHTHSLYVSSFSFSFSFSSLSLSLSHTIKILPICAGAGLCGQEEKSKKKN